MIGLDFSQKWLLHYPKVVVRTKPEAIERKPNINECQFFGNKHYGELSCSPVGLV